MTSLENRDFWPPLSRKFALFVTYRLKIFRLRRYFNVEKTNKPKIFRLRRYFNVKKKISQKYSACGATTVTYRKNMHFSPAYGASYLSQNYAKCFSLVAPVTHPKKMPKLFWRGVSRAVLVAGYCKIADQNMGFHVWYPIHHARFFDFTYYMTDPYV